MSGISKPVFLKCLTVVLAMTAFAADREIQRNQGFSSAAALEEALAELGLKPNEVSVALIEPESIDAAEKEIPAWARLAGSDLGRALRMIDQTGPRLDSMSRAEDFLGCTFLEAGDADTVARPIRQENALSPSGREAISFAPALLRDSLDTLIRGAGGALDYLLAADSLVRRAFCRLTTVERRELTVLIRGFRPEEDQWPGYPVERMISLAGRVEVEELRLSGLMAAQAAKVLRRALESRDREPDSTTGAGKGRALLSLDTPWGAVRIITPALAGW